ncbi:unnamed protein product [Cunninghamella echinulata]
MWRKRLFEQLSNDYNTNAESATKRLKEASGLPCPNCALPLVNSIIIDSIIGLKCQHCFITIPLSNNLHLPSQKIADMVNLAQQQHEKCANNNKSILETSTLGIPNGDEFLVWKCQYCGEFEILL